jgi:transcriptional regulator with XRE-family HTH domain
MQQIERYWKSKFARFVKSYGVIDLAKQLGIDPSAIYHWIQGDTAPRPVYAEIIQRVARERGARLTMDQIYGHFLSLRDRAAEVPSERSLEASAGAARLAPRLDSQWK